MKLTYETMFKSISLESKEKSLSDFRIILG